mmetsp:Transcript_37591/g.107868  ORF Transcript_37591/g.107868 Transcript_37591/m.107868 type:complete len:193 (+) Transcript_37591:89-667(+)
MSLSASSPAQVGSARKTMRRRSTKGPEVGSARKTMRRRSTKGPEVYSDPSSPEPAASPAQSRSPAVVATPPPAQRKRTAAAAAVVLAATAKKQPRAEAPVPKGPPALSTKAISEALKDTLEKEKQQEIRSIEEALAKDGPVAEAAAPCAWCGVVAVELMEGGKLVACTRCRSMYCDCCEDQHSMECSTSRRH